MEATIQALISEKKESGKSTENEEAASGAMSTANAQKTVQCVVKLLGTTKYTGTERNQYESWVQFKTQLESAVTFYPELLELVCDYQVSDIADIKGLNVFMPKSKGYGNTAAEEKPSSRAEDKPALQAEDEDVFEEVLDNNGSFVTVPGSASMASTILSAILKQVEPKGDEFTGVVKLKSAGGRTFWTPVSVFLEARVEHLELLFEFRVKLTVNLFYPLFEKVELQQSGGGEWEAAVVCATAREDHVLPYQVILERHAGVSGSAVDVCEARVRVENRHVALAAREEKLTGLPVGVTEPKGWVQLLKGPDAVQWQESNHKEECALIDVKKAIAPVESVPAGEKVMRMTAVYKAKLDSAGEVTERKTRWVVCGNGQQHGVHYEDVYAPCTQLSTLRILIQLSLVLGLLVFALDVITCFLNGELDVYTPMYVSWPNARTVRGVLYGMLQKSVYGLKQAPRIWYKTSKNFLLAYDSRLRVSNIDPCLFYIWQLGTLVVFVYVHVDDYTVFTSSVEWKAEFFKAFSEKYPSKDKGPLVELLGMSMTFSDYGLVRECQISQVGLIQRMLERYSMQDCNPCMTPMEPRLSLLPVDSEEKLEKLPYVNLVLSLLWAGALAAFETCAEIFEGNCSCLFDFAVQFAGFTDC
ncbi:hypothetical protein CYMTET_7061 [Cymbomonas tetramitiformis]|uniref:Reverse transcriptase Ty1/copia-type domain-containing protein n=1 Tax=Cymbomonas tetramitiformis TaxID=36881 RepID=A0AAE0GW76_9CHLO|nr:hypothetical protein CYMTET_7061 [Cymbomonas tetramitiformis]